MAQLFSRRASKWVSRALFISPVVLAAAAGGAYLFLRSDQVWNVGIPAQQPIPFRHDVHAGAIGLDCRYCHSSVENAASAGMPSAQTCLTCHSQVWSGLATLEPLRTSAAFGAPLEWASVHKLPDHAFFHHGIHVSKGVSCQTCHGRVDQMPQTVKTETLSMGWCLDCHRDPGPELSAPRDVFAMNDVMLATEPDGMLEVHGVSVGNLTDCSTCHR